jgi:hypothetical protein
MTLDEATKPASEKRECNSSPVIWWGRLPTDNLLLITFSFSVLMNNENTVSGCGSEKKGSQVAAF